MKKFIIAQKIGTGTKEDSFRPDLGMNIIGYSCMQISDVEFLVRLSVLPENTGKLNGNEISDDEALTLIKTKSPNSNLINLDVPDVETDYILKILGENPDEIRKHSGETLIEQEWGVVDKIAKIKKIDITTYKTDFQKGRCDKHASVLAKLKG